MKTLKSSTVVVATCLATLLTAAPNLSTAATINVYPALAPNAFGSPSYAPWVANAVASLYNGAASGGTVGTPSYYSQVSGTLSISQLIVTGFPSWLSQANPGTVFGPGYASELGNRLAEGLTINGNGTQFSISQLSFNMVSTDPANGLNFGFGAGSYNYSADYVGILFGGDGIWGGGDDTFITSGPNTQLVDGLVGRGSGNAWAVYDTDPGATQQDKIDLVLADPNFAAPFAITGTYSLGTDTGSAVVNVIPVPEPSVAALGGVAGLALFWGLRRRMPR